MTLEELIQKTDSIVSLPSIFSQLEAMLESPTSTAEDVARLIEQEPGLSLRLLRLANSPAYGFSSRIDSIQRAVSVLGSKLIRDLVLATTVVDTFSGIPNHLVSMENFWKHSIYCAIAAADLAGRSDAKGTESAFIAGMLHDIGQLAMFHAMPEQCRDALIMSAEDPTDPGLAACEKSLIGFDHAEAGAALARLWNLPISICDSIAMHHHPAQASGNRALVSIVHIANSIAVLHEIESTNPQDAAAISDEAWKETGLDPNVIPEVITQIQARAGEIQALLSGDAQHAA